MNDYQQRKMTDYVLPQAVYRQALYAVKDLNRMKRKLTYLEESASLLEGREMKLVTGGKGKLADLTAKRAVDIATVKTRIEAIESAFTNVPEAYRGTISDKLLSDVPYSEEHSINTWKKWQQILIYHVAVNLKLL